MTLNHYSILGFPPNGIDANGEPVNKTQIRKAYRTKSIIYHPDKNPDAQEEAAARFREVQEAYEILLDDNKRALYDEILEETTEEDDDPSLRKIRCICIIKRAIVICV
jgi:curved DNA-binding protein CbpA